LAEPGNSIRHISWEMMIPHAASCHCVLFGQRTRPAPVSLKITCRARFFRERHSTFSSTEFLNTICPGLSRSVAPPAVARVLRNITY
ncbi:MAG TPA: hypothetical protein VLM91_11720, partial [Candidatus Methylomirabilis sp.]|nr:hypothetical protein [Candidatus Methylomirabilis sp.]